MIYEKKLLNTILKYDTDEEKLYRFNKIYNKWTLIDPGIQYDETKNKFIYYNVEIDKKSFQIHRLIYYVCNSDFDIFDSKVTIDHINVNHFDNKLENLRTASMAEQNRNRNYNKYGELIKGFTLLKTGKKKYRAYYYINKKQITKLFYTEQEAVAFYNDNRNRF